VGLVSFFIAMGDKSQSETLKIGDRAPAFSLTAANGEGGFSLATILQRGPAIVEFLRGTW
jgi:peroxiredoxin